MKQSQIRIRRRRESGIALITVLLISVATAMLLGASLCVTLTSSKLGWSQARAEVALQLADAGINSELQYIAQNQGQSLISLKSSQPLAAVGVTIKYPGENFAIKGRSGTVPGFSSGNFWVYSSNDAAGTTAWDGVTSPFYITASGYVNKTWQRVQVSTQTTSLFNLYGTIALGSYNGNSTGVTVAPSASVVVTGPAGRNGQVSTGTGSTFTAPQAINANGCTYSNGQFTSSHVATGGTLVSCNQPYVYPTCAQIIKQACGHNEYSDDDAWTWRKSNCDNANKVYTYRSDATDSTIKASNCTKVVGGCGTVLNNADWNTCNTKPGTYDSSGYYWFWYWQNPTVSVQTLIFEPGDYYFSSVQLAYDASCEMIADTQAYASGGTPGQIRFWIYDKGSSVTDDCIQLPITNTLAAGETDADCGRFRMYFGKDGHECQFKRPSGCKDWQGNTRNDDFEYHCGVYACSKQPDQIPASTGNGCQSNPSSDSTKTGCQVHLCGQTSRSSGCAKITGSCLTDKLKCEGGCTLNYKASNYCNSDPCSGGKILSWCKK